MRTVDMVTVGLWTAQLIQLILNGIFCAHVLTPRFSGNRTLALATLFQLPYILISHFFISNGVVNWICAASYLLMTFRIFYTDSWLRIVAAVCGIYLLIFPTTFIAASLMRLFGIMPYDVLEGRLEMMGNFLFSFVYFAVIYIFIFFY